MLFGAGKWQSSAASYCDSGIIRRTGTLWSRKMPGLMPSAASTVWNFPFFQWQKMRRLQFVIIPKIKLLWGSYRFPYFFPLPTCHGEGCEVRAATSVSKPRIEYIFSHMGLKKKQQCTTIKRGTWQLKSRSSRSSPLRKMLGATLSAAISR